MNWLDEVKWDAQGLAPAIAQERGTGDVLMLAWMNRAALAETAASGRAVYWSRSRGKLWVKGEESGHAQRVHEIRLDCDGDVILLAVTQLGHEPGIACHTGRHSCFYRALREGRWQPVDPVLKDPSVIYQPSAMSNQPAVADPPERVLERLTAVIESRLPARGGDPEKSYVARLLAKGPDGLLKKIGEEAAEVVMAAKDAEHGGARERVVAEMADLWFHGMVALARYGLTAADVVAELARREGLSGLDEKALRRHTS